MKVKLYQKLNTCYIVLPFSPQLRAPVNSDFLQRGHFFENHLFQSPNVELSSTFCFSYPKKRKKVSKTIMMPLNLIQVPWLLPRCLHILCLYKSIHSQEPIAWDSEHVRNFQCIVRVPSPWFAVRSQTQHYELV